MPTVTIDVTDEEHARLKAGAEREGRTIAEVIRSRVLTDDAQYAADVAKLGEFLEPRLRSAKEGKVFPADFAKVRERAMARLKAGDG